MSHFLLLHKKQWELYITNNRLNIPLTSNDIVTYVNKYIKTNIPLSKLTGRLHLIFRDIVGDLKKEKIINTLLLRKKIYIVF